MTEQSVTSKGFSSGFGMAMGCFAAVLVICVVVPIGCIGCMAMVGTARQSARERERDTLPEQSQELSPEPTPEATATPRRTGPRPWTKEERADPTPTQPAPEPVTQESAVPEEPSKDYREWSIDGERIEAEFISFDGVAVTLKRRDGSPLVASLYKLSSPDVQWVVDHKQD